MKKYFAHFMIPKSKLLKLFWLRTNAVENIAYFLADNNNIVY